MKLNKKQIIIILILVAFLAVFIGLLREEVFELLGM